MSTKPETPEEKAVVARRTKCALCQGPLSVAIELAGLPITDTYCREAVVNTLAGIDQKLLYCESCGHGQAQVLIAPEVLYGSNYCFRTSASATARKGTEFFLSVLDRVAPGRQFNSVLDLGCNDLFLLDHLKGRAQYRAGIDPVWTGREDERPDKSIQLFGRNFEDVDLSSLPAKPDLIVCRHTLEHIFEPRAVVERLLAAGADDALFLFEVPGFDGLVERMRFDQVFHQHVQYFTLHSFLKLLGFVGGKYVAHQFNYHDWGAMAVAFSKRESATSPKAKLWTLAEIQERYALFREQMKTAGKALRFFAGKLYGYGAAQMLPVLGYHMGTDFSELTAVVDDDPSKDGIGYWNLPVKVISSKCAGDLSDATVLVTAIDNVQPIMTKLLAHRPRHIINPLNVI
jgi:hypothetical protein